MPIDFGDFARPPPSLRLHVFLVTAAVLCQTSRADCWFCPSLFAAPAYGVVIVLPQRRGIVGGGHYGGRLETRAGRKARTRTRFHRLVDDLGCRKILVLGRTLTRTLSG